MTAAGMDLPPLPDERLGVVTEHLRISTLTSVHDNVVFSDFLLTHGRLSHDMLTTGSDKSHGSDVAPWEARNMEIISCRGQGCADRGICRRIQRLHLDLEDDRCVDSLYLYHITLSCRSQRLRFHEPSKGQTV